MGLFDDAKIWAGMLKTRLQVEGVLPSRYRWCPYTPSEKQYALLSVDPEECFYGGAAFGGKLLRLDEPIPTPEGFTLNGDLEVGDEIFDELGKITLVTNVFEITIPGKAYRLTFDDGSIIEAGSEHQWLTYDAKELAALTRRNPEWRARRRSKRPSRAKGKKSKLFTDSLITRNKTVNIPETLNIPTGTVRTTQEIFNTLRTESGRANHAIPVAKALELPEIILPLDPYCLGAWLGDGTKASGGFTGIDPEIWQAFEVAGFSVSHSQTTSNAHYVTGLQSQLRRLGLLNDKHIPAIYLRSSREQRLALIQGLMDTDGTVDKEKGSVSFTNTSKEIVDSLYQLIVSLGWKACIRESRAKLNGKDCGPVWDITWTSSDYVFRLKRKRDFQILARGRKTKFRYITDCQPCIPVPMRCISVDSPNHLYLAGKNMIPTHNTAWLLMAALKFVDHPRYRAVILRRTYTALEQPDAIIEQSRQWLAGTGADYREKFHEWVFPSGARIKFDQIRTNSDLQKYQGGGLHFVGFDELSQFTQFQYSYLFSRVRKHKDVIEIPLRVCSASNPDYSALWIYEHFIKNATKISEFLFSKRHRSSDGIEWDSIFCPARMADNPGVDQQSYIRSLAHLDPVLRKQLLEGDWDVRPTGDIYPYKEPWQVITKREFANVFGSRDIPVHWPLSMGMDWGASEKSTTCASWVATSPRNSPLPNRKFVYRERVWLKPTEQVVANEIIKSESKFGENKRFQFRVLSHDAATEKRTFQESYGLHFQHALHQVTLGISTVRYSLDLQHLDEEHPFRPGLAGQPMLYFVVEDDQGECYQTEMLDDNGQRIWIVDQPRDQEGLIQHRIEAAGYRWDETGKAPVKNRDNMMDALRMVGCKAFPIPKNLSRDEQNDSKLPSQLHLTNIWDQYNKTASAKDLSQDQKAGAFVKLNQDILNRDMQLSILREMEKRVKPKIQGQVKVWQRPFGVR